MDTETTLKQFGLNNKEIKTYIALLQLGKATVLEIAKKSGIKRPTTYLTLEELAKKGLISKIPRKNKTLFVAENPEKLIQISEKRKKDIISIIPSLLGIHNVKIDKPQVQLYEGKEGIQQAYEIIMQTNEVWWFGNLEMVNKKFEYYVDEFNKLIKAKKLKLRDFIGDSDWEKEYAKKHPTITNHEVRISSLPRDIDFAIFEDKVSILSMADSLYAVIIQDQKIADSFRSLYELAWQKAGKYKPKN